MLGWRVGANQLQNVIVDEICLSAPTYNHGNNIVVLFDALLNFPFTTSETSEARLLVTNKVYKSCLTTCRTI